MNNRLKIRSYAIFQFISFFAIIALLLAAVLIGYTVIFDKGNTDQSLATGSTWAKYILGVLRWEHLETIGTAASTMTYVSLITFLGSWVAGWMIFRVKNRNLFDSLFLLFLCLPIISNIFALFAQVATKEITFSSSKIDKKAVIQEQTRILKLEHKKEIRRQNALLAKRKEAAKAKDEEIKAAQEKAAATQAAKIEKIKHPHKKPSTKKTTIKKPTAKKPSVRKPIVKKAPVKKPTATKAKSKK